jgi:DNA-binding CsgD family transcriptional regulator
MGGCLARSDSTDLLIGLMRAPERGHFTAKQEIFLTRLMPHFNRALRLMEHTRAAAGLAEPAPTPDDATAYVLIALDKSGRLLYCNPRGEALLTAAEVLRRERTAVSCPDSPQNTLFADAIAVTVQTGRPGNLLLHNPMRPAERYSVTLIPLPERGAFSLHGSPDGVLCLMAPLDCRRVASVPQLMRLFGLTDAEARLACALATGETLASYAREHALAPAAVNRQVRTVFEKTDTRALADLVRLLTRLPAA